MGQQKIKLELIEDERKRKITFKVREKGIVKKVSELSTLCDIHACAVIYSPYDVEPTVWPSHLGVQQVISEFTNIPDSDKKNRSLNHASFLRKMIGKIDGKMKRQQTQNRANGLHQMMIDGMILDDEILENLSPAGLDALMGKVDKTMDEVNARLETTNTIPNDDAFLIPPPSPPPPPPPPAAAAAENSITSQPQSDPYSLPSLPPQLDFTGMEQIGDQNINPPEDLDDYLFDQCSLVDMLTSEDEVWRNQLYPNASYDQTIVPYIHEPNPNFFNPPSNLP